MGHWLYREILTGMKTLLSYSWIKSYFPQRRSSPTGDGQTSQQENKYKTNKGWPQFHPETLTRLLWHGCVGKQRASCPNEPHDAIHLAPYWVILPSFDLEKQFFLLNGRHLPWHSPPHSWAVGTSSTRGTSPRSSHCRLGNIFLINVKSLWTLP